MFSFKTGGDREENYRLMVEAADEFIKDEHDLIALLSNLSALIKVYADDINWAGFYLLKEKELVLGPFQGFPACTRIAEGKGVCGKAVLEGKAIAVADVRRFPGHIACDASSVSELVLPFFRAGKVYGVLDLDSPLLNRFGELETEYFGKIAALLTIFLDTSLPNFLP